MSALLPRLSGAQDIARDTARQVAVNQLYTAIMSYKSLHGKYPVLTEEWCTWSDHLGVLVNDGLLTEIPTDPNPDEEWTWNIKAWWDVKVTWGYIYCLVKKNGSKKAWGYIFAKTETPAKSNLVWQSSLTVTWAEDYKNQGTCSEIKKADSKMTVTGWTMNYTGCTYTDNQELFYILKF